MTTTAIPAKLNVSDTANSMPNRMQPFSCHIRNIVNIVALAVLAALAVFIAATAGLVLSGIVACVIAALSTAVLITAAFLVYKILQPKTIPPVAPQINLIPKSLDTIPKSNCEQTTSPQALSSIAPIVVSTAPPSLIPKSFKTIPKINCEQATSLEALGTVDPFMIASLEPNALFFVVHRSNGNVALISHGLWDPKNPTESFELLVEFPKSQFVDLDSCVIYQAFLSVVRVVTAKIAQISEVTKAKKHVTIEVKNVPTLPNEFLHTHSKMGCMLLGLNSSIGNDAVPKYIKGPNNIEVPLVTAKLLSLSEWQDCQPFKIGKNGLATRFKTNGTHHVSNILCQSAASLTQRIPIQPGVEWNVQKVMSHVQAYKQSPHSLVPLEVLCDLSDYDPPIDPSVIVDSFVRNEFANHLSEMTVEASKILNKKSKANDMQMKAAENIYTLLSDHSQLYGWYHAAGFISDPHHYVTQLGKQFNLPQTLPPLGPTDITGAIETLNDKARDLTKTYIQRMEWICEILKRESIPFDPRFSLEILRTDEPLMAEIDTFNKNTLTTIQTLISENQDRLNLYKDFIQNNRIHWPHHSISKEIKNTGFSHFPSLAKRDRCICRTCQVEVYGWRPWMDPEQLHDQSKHVNKTVK